MTEREEYKMTLSRVKYGTGCGPKPNEDIRMALKERIDKTGTEPFVPMTAEPLELTALLMESPTLNRIYSVSLDIRDCLPFRPDLSFDRCWSAFEAMLIHYHEEMWRSGAAKTPPTHTLFRRFCSEVVSPILEKDERLREEYDSFLSLMPVSVTRYASVRMLLDREIRVASQHFNIRERAIDALGKELFDLFEAEYITEEKGIRVIGPENHHRAERKLFRVLTGQPLKFNEKGVKGIDGVSRMEFILSCILYVSRCERVHGDYFSPFFSFFTDMRTYAGWYWILNMTYLLFGILLQKIGDSRHHQVVANKTLIQWLHMTRNNLHTLFAKEIGRRSFNLLTKD